MTVRSLLFVLLIAFSRLAAAEDLSAEKRGDIEQLLRMTRATAIGLQMANAIVGQLAQSIRTLRPDIPQEAIDVLPAEVAAVLDANIAALTEQLILIYHKHFSGAEIKGLIAFYTTELGAKTIQVLPVLVNDSMVAGQRWGQSMGPAIESRVRARLKKDGYSL
ncbi:MAG: DUF2059 domain-containing protein [Betaproteobacteria bacterium]|nr:DUF2059 domain-containing protein [Betaproteobacteria bacterium]